MSGHTKGPWFVTGSKTKYVEARIDGGLIQEVAAVGPTEADNGYGPQQEANACLISVAPNLLDAAEKTMAWWNDAQYWTTGERGEYNVFDEDPDFVIAARAAIAKAKEASQ